MRKRHHIAVHRDLSTLARPSSYTEEPGVLQSVPFFPGG